MRRSPVVVAFGAVLVCACNRPAPEEFSSASASPQPVAKLSPPAASDVQSRTHADGSRCVRATPDVPPAPVAPGPAPGCPADPEKSPPKLPIVRVAFVESGASVEAELAREQHDTMRGLMFRRSMREDHGMLFDLGTRENHEFWMHNTCIPLDLLYVDEDGLIVGIVENAPTLNDDSRGVDCPSRYVLEVNAGWARRHHVKAGQQMTIPPGAR